MLRQQQRDGARGDARDVGIGATGQDHRHFRAEHDTGAGCITEIHQLLGQHVAAFQIRHHQDVGLAGDRRGGALGAGGGGRHGRVERQGAGGPGTRATHAGVARLRQHAWPGNLRELANALERATIVTPGRELGPDAFDFAARAAAPTPPPITTPAPPDSDRVLTLEEAQAEHIQRVLLRTHGRIYGPGGAAELLGVKPSTLQSKMKKLGVQRA